ncbi:MAG: hypothetical protein DHS80DRAFT_33098 [Piptocephalis tieghemiana]|nr:MAG: hypothetical protein DHS80DRAFT_33098 [Piptocephalis tieghemiana]
MSSTTQLHPCIISFLQNLASYSPRTLDHPGGPGDGRSCRRAAVALVLRRPPPSPDQPPLSPLSLPEILNSAHHDHHTPIKLKPASSHSDWSSSLELLYIVRATNRADPWSGQVAFPGGKADPEDESDQATAERETLEEVGLDLQSPDFAYVGSLDHIHTDRPSSKSQHRTHLLISPHVFLHTGVSCPPIQANPDEVSNTLWVPLSLLISSMPPDYTIRICLTSRFLPPSRTLLFSLARPLLGDLLLPGIPLMAEERMSRSHQSAILLLFLMFRLTRIPSPPIDYPQDLEGLGYTFTSEGQMIDQRTGEAAAPKPPRASRDAWIRAYSVGLNKEVQRWMQDQWHLKPMPLTNPDLPHATIYHSEDLLTSPSNILILIPTIGQGIGQWYKSAIQDVGMREGAVGSYVDMARELGYAIVVLAPGDIYWRDGSSDCETPEKYIVTAMNLLFRLCPSQTSKFHVVAHGYSGHLLVDWLAANFSQRQSQLGLMALISSHHNLSSHTSYPFSEDLMDWFFHHASHWDHKAADPPPPSLPAPSWRDQVGEVEEEEEGADSGWGKPDDEAYAKWEEEAEPLSLVQRYGCPHTSIDPIHPTKGVHIPHTYTFLLPHDVLSLVRSFFRQDSS